MGFLRRLLGSKASAASSGSTRDLSPLPLTWRDDTTMPIADWEAARESGPPRGDDGAANTYWWRAAWTWVEALRVHLGSAYAIEHSDNFVMLSPLTAKARQLALAYCERSRRRILQSLQGVAASWGHGPHVVLIFDGQDAYYDYIGNYYPERGEFAMSSGMFLQHGYGHFVFDASEPTTMEPIIVHELTHCLLAPLPLPAWLNEGTAVNMEKQLTPNWQDPRQGIFAHREHAKQRAKFWTAATIQQFWSGKSFLRPDEGCSLSYDLAEELTRLIARDFDKYRAYMNAAHRNDAGEKAARAILDFTLGDLAAAVLGPGEWAPDAKSWREGTERGQF